MGLGSPQRSVRVGVNGGGGGGGLPTGATETQASTGGGGGAGGQDCRAHRHGTWVEGGALAPKEPVHHAAVTAAWCILCDFLALRDATNTARVYGLCSHTFAAQVVDTIIGDRRRPIRQGDGQ